MNPGLQSSYTAMHKQAYYSQLLIDLICLKGNINFLNPVDRFIAIEEKESLFKSHSLIYITTENH